MLEDMSRSIAWTCRHHGAKAGTSVQDAGGWVHVKDFCEFLRPPKFPKTVDGFFLSKLLYLVAEMYTNRHGAKRRFQFACPLLPYHTFRSGSRIANQGTPPRSPLTSSST